MESLSEKYVKTILQIGGHDSSYVDAYYGPAEWEAEVKSNPKKLQEILQDISQLKAMFQEQKSRMLEQLKIDELLNLRMIFLEKQLIASETHAKNLISKREVGKVQLSFDEESSLLYDAKAPNHTQDDFRQIVGEIEKLLPPPLDESETLIQRYTRFKKDFIIPKEKLEVVFKTSIGEARDRTKKWCQLPEKEEFVLEFVTNKPWSGYNWFKGGSFSVIQINTDLPIYIDRAIDLAAHEGYPGHHVNNTLLEKNLVKERNWVEFSIYPLYSPQSLIAEGSANYGIDVCFPDRIEYESKVLFPLAGIDPAKAPAYYQIEEKVAKLSYAGNEAARGYLNGKFDKQQAVDWLTNWGLMPYERALKRVDFFDAYRSYVINYNLGQDIVKNYVIKECAKRSGDQEKIRWEIFLWLLSTPQVASNLEKN